MSKISIAIDGPAGAGKSSISKEVAGNLKLTYVDTGAMYRACALYAINAGIPIEPEALRPELDKINIDIEYKDGTQMIFLNGEEVSDEIRKPEISMGASKIAAIPEIRLKLVALQRELASKRSVIMDGRDIGTYVLPEATLKIYLTASVARRAERRCREQLEKGIKCDFEAVKADIEVRDRNDMTREFAPLKKAEDAVLLDSSDLSFEEVVQRVTDMAKKVIEKG